MKSTIRLDVFQRFALLTTAATYALITLGGLVRASDSGLGCPDWPKCFDRWIPPLHASDVPAHIDPALFNVAKAWTEYLNRLVGVGVGVLIFATFVLAFRRHRSTPRILWPTVSSFVLVGVEGWIGGRVVESGLSPLVLSVHLVFALAIVSLLLYATVQAFFPRGRRRPGLSPDRLKLGRIGLAVSAAALLEVGIGAALRGEIQRVATGIPSLARARWLDSVGTIALVHKGYAPFVAVMVMLLVWFVHRKTEPDRWLRGTALLALFLVTLQVLAGAGLARFGLPRVLQVVHLSLGALLLGALTVLCLLAYRLDPREAGADALR